MLWKLLAVVALVTTGVAVFVVHTITGSNIHTIAEARSADMEGGTVSIHGTITYANDNKFAIKDHTGSAELSTCPMWYKQISIFPGDEVTVIGQVMRPRQSISKPDLSISVYRFIRNDEVIIVRDKPGKPPWASTSLP